MSRAELFRWFAAGLFGNAVALVAGLSDVVWLSLLGSLLSGVAIYQCLRAARPTETPE